MKESILNVAGNEYTIQCDPETGKLVKVACKGRWPLTKVEWIGLDEWTLGQLQAHAKLVCMVVNSRK